VRRLKNEEGTTLIELLSAQLVAGFVLTAALMMVVMALKSSSRVTDRVAAAQEGRIAMEQIQQRLRSQTCMFPLEYTVNGSTVGTGVSRPGIIHASSTKLIFLGDVGNTGGTTSATGSVGYRPQLRWLRLVTDATGRNDTIVEGWRDATTTTSPYNFALTPSTSFDALATTAGSNTITPATSRPIIKGVTWVVSGAIGSTGPVGPTVPYLSYYDASDSLLTEQASGGIPTGSIGAIERVTVSFRSVSPSGKLQDQVQSEWRLPSFQNNIYLRTLSDRCT
jgi:hypothetical protein